MKKVSRTKFLAISTITYSETCWLSAHAATRINFITSILHPMNYWYLSNDFLIFTLFFFLYLKGTLEICKVRIQLKTELEFYLGSRKVIARGDCISSPLRKWQ